MLENKYANQKVIFYFIFDGNSNVGAICHHFKAIHSLIAAEPDLDRSNGQGQAYVCQWRLYI